MLVGVLASLAAVAALPAPAGDSAGDAGAEHVRDKRRLPEPGFIVPATPMGFARQERTNEEPAPPSNKVRSTADRSLAEWVEALVDQAVGGGFNAH